MGEPELRVYPTAPDVSHAAARRIADAIGSAVAERGVAHWVTTGGSTPGQIYRHLADSPLRETVPWDRVHLWWSDDRWVPPDDVLSNALACWDLLLRDVPVPLDQVHVVPVAEAMRAGEGPEIVAARYEATMRDAGLDLDEAGFPIMDVILVGVGSDGHLFSVFPDSATWDDPRWVQAVPAPTHITPHVARVTLQPEPVTAARLPLAVVMGASKAAILAEIFGPEHRSPRASRHSSPAATAPSGCWMRRWPRACPRRSPSATSLPKAMPARPPSHPTVGNR